MLRSIVLISLVAAPALASTQYPTVIQTKYSLATPPAQSCSLCHTNGITGTGTVNTPIGKALRMRGLVSNDDASLIAALNQLATDAVDSDGDGTTDVAELMAGTNPNVSEGGTGGGAGGGGGTTTVVPGLKYGCGASVVPELLLVASLALLRRRVR